MAKLLAIDWDQREVRMVVAQARGEKVVIDKAIAAPLNLSTQQADHDDLAKQLTDALKQAGIPKCRALTAIGRAQVELGVLQLPPAPEDELPEMVRFQAMREFTSLQESSLLDFVPLGEVGRERGEVIAAAIPQALFAAVHDTLGAEGHEPQRATLRPCAVASLALRQEPTLASGVGLVIAQQSGSAELAVVKNGLVVFARSFRLPPDWMPGETGEPLLGEVRRTIAAAQNQLGASRIERILLFGTPAVHAELCQRLRDRTRLDVELLDPFRELEGGTSVDHPERFAAAIGMLRDEAGTVAPVVDFLNPRKAPEPESHTRSRVFYGGLAAAVVLGIAALVMWQYRNLDQQIQSQSRRLAAVANENKNLRSTVQLAKELREWKMADRNWLDELAHLSEVDGLNADDFMLDAISGRTLRNNQGVLELRGKSRDLLAQQKLQVAWADEEHMVSPKVSSPIRSNKDSRYPKMFEAMVSTDRAIPIVQRPTGPPPTNTDPVNAKDNETATPDQQPGTVSAEGEPEPVEANPSERDATKEGAV